MTALYALAECLRTEIAQHLPLCTLSLLATASREHRRVATKAATDEVRRTYEGISLTGDVRRAGRAVPEWLATLLVLRSRCLAFGHSTVWPSQTCGLPFALESVGPWFVEFQFVAARAPSGTGTPRIGLLDAAARRETSDGFGSLWACDMSQQGGSGCFAVSLAPYDGTLFATRPDCQTCSRARLNWQPAFEQQRCWNDPIQVGFLVHGRSLTFYRTDHCGDWHSGETVCKDLPTRIVPCVVISSYAGYTLVHFKRVWSHPPSVCPFCDPACHGFAEPWSSLS